MKTYETLEVDIRGMLTNYPKIGIVYLSFHSEPYLDDVVSALKKMTYPKTQVEFIIVDNPHPEFGSSARYITENILPLSEKELPRVTLLAQAANLGFSGGNNVGIRWALEHGCDYIFLHNNDGFVAASAFEPLVTAMENDKTIGASQSLMLMYPETDLINSAGNAYHYLGIGYCGNFREPKQNLSLPEVSDTGYVSGAAVMLRADLLTKYGLWDEDFFLYHEDIEYSLRLRAMGFRAVIVRDSIFYHKYNFSRNKEKFYYFERNRLGTLMIFYKLPTLLLLLPAGLFWELGILVFAAQNGWLTVKLKTYGYWLKPSSWRLWLPKRKRLQKSRVVGDRQLLAAAVNKIIFPEKSIDTPLLKYVANPILTAYWWVVKKIIFW